MKKLVILLLVIAPYFVFSQGQVTNEINWISLEKAKKYAKKYNKNIFVYFHKKDCPYCEKMKRETFSDQTVINLINYNFFPVKIDSRTKVRFLNGNYIKFAEPLTDGPISPHNKLETLFNYYYYIEKYIIIN